MGLGDLGAALCAWVCAYYFRFYVDFIPVTKGIPEFKLYFFLMPLVVLIWGIVLKAYGLYEPRRLRSFRKEASSLFFAATLALLILIVTSYFLQEYKFSRLVFIYFYFFNLLFIGCFRFFVRRRIINARSKGKNLHNALILGHGKLARQVLDTIQHHPELGIQIRGFVTRERERVGNQVEGLNILGSYENLPEIIKNQEVEQVFIAFSIQDHGDLEAALGILDEEMVDISVIPDMYRFAALKGSIEEFDGLPVINLRTSPLFGWNRIIKRGIDILATLILLIPGTPLMAIIALVIKIFTPGPVLYGQERMGLGGTSFVIYKFRTMKIGAEEETGPVWATLKDPRRTRVGKFLRKTSLDELPQLINILKGDMSLVGPRPERPVFIEEFKSSIPKYILRHRVKAGLTGWAQVNGWRGNTSLEKRIEHDLYYIAHWSLGLDFKIILKTIPSLFSGKGAM
ncbi:MAG: undecaprenyl-phosphate glucose phosphotransferase [Deltaproteobacteria bacterium]|nr:undecaprenyl-phosphate glucose phosphotransferase [Deltaproteobacteria bacterium]